MGLLFGLKSVESREDALGHEISYFYMERSLKFMGLGCNQPHVVTPNMSLHELNWIRVSFFSFHVVNSLWLHRESQIYPKTMTLTP